jgi:hypothetical protein
MSGQKPAPDPIRGAKRFGDKDMLQHIDLARFLFGKPIPACREAR